MLGRPADSSRMCKLLADAGVAQGKGVKKGRATAPFVVCGPGASAPAVADNLPWRLGAAHLEVHACTPTTHWQDGHRSRMGFGVSWPVCRCGQPRWAHQRLFGRKAALLLQERCTVAPALRCFTPTKFPPLKRATRAAARLKAPPSPWCKRLPPGVQPTLQALGGSQRPQALRRPVVHGVLAPRWSLLSSVHVTAMPNASWAMSCAARKRACPTCNAISLAASPRARVMSATLRVIRSAWPACARPSSARKPTSPPSSASWPSCRDRPRGLSPRPGARRRAP